MRQKILITLLLSTLSLISFSQTDYSEKIIGTWSYTDTKGKTQQFSVSKDTWTYYSPATFSGKWTISKGNKIHIIFHDKPREESFVEIISLDEPSLIIKQSEYKNMKDAVKYVCKKE